MKNQILIILCAMFIVSTALAVWPEQQKLTASDGTTEDRFGSAVAIDGFTAVVAAYFDDVAGPNSGSAYVFEFDGTNWTQQAKLTASDGAAGDELGFGWSNSTSISGDTAIIGAHFDDDGGNNSGSAYIFKKPAGGWVSGTETAKLTASDAAADDGFGYSASIEGNYAIVGAPGDDPDGSAYVFFFNGLNWTQQAKLTGSSPDSGFGFTVSIRGSYAIVGVPGGMSVNGVAYVFERSGVNWTQKARLTASDGLGADGLGRAVAIGIDYALVGAPGHDLTYGGEGAVYVFKKPAAGWVNATETAKLTTSDAGASDAFGNSISTSGNYALIGAYQDYDNGIYAGSSYIFKRDAAGTWTEKDKLLASDGAARDNFGRSVSLSGDYALIGAYVNDNANGVNAGAAYVFERGPDLGDGTVKWLQLPDETTEGIDIRCDRNDGILRTLADDFECNSPSLITDVHLWGSWKGEPFEKGNITSIHLSIHKDIPASQSSTGYSMPGALLWQKDFSLGDFNETLYKDIIHYEWWWDPYTGDLIADGDHQIWQYDIYIDPCNAFYQEGTAADPCIYWLDVYVLTTDQRGEFGWKTTKDHWNDDAVRSITDNPWWEELIYPPEHPNNPNSIDLAFAITSKERETDNVKWIQYPDTTENGIDIRVDRCDGRPRIMADDFPCTTTGLITDVHFWGSWKYDDKGNITKIHLSIHDDDPVGPGGSDPDNLYSKPDQLLWEMDFPPGAFVESLYYTLPGGQHEWWWDIQNDIYFPTGDTQVWKYDVYINPCDAFKQQGSIDNLIIYWLDLYVETDGGPDEQDSGKFGWKTRLWPDHYQDDAVYAVGQIPPFNWMELRYPVGHEYENESIDMAFAITTEANEPEPEPKEFLRHLKWSQPPIEIDPDGDDATFCGWDEKSFNNDIQNPDGLWKIVADDFRCLGTMPITSIHWWGSYYDWETGPGLPTDLPTKWWIGFWSNVPENINAPYSYPEVLLKDFTVDASRVEIVEVGKDEYYREFPNDICYQYYVDFREEEIFRQHELLDMTQDDVFWISIVAIYEDGVEPSNPWGWKTRPWHWMDDAVTFNTSAQPAAGAQNDPALITPLKDPVWQESFDVSFEFDTDPNYIKWEQDFNGIRNWPHYEDVKSTFNIHEQPEEERLVADDWRCLRRTPVTAIVWWGSYIGYRYQACGDQPLMPIPTQPDKFRLVIWKDIPVGADPQYDFSHPGEQIWMFETNQYDEVLVGFDKHPNPAHGGEEPYAIEPVFRYSLKLPEDMWFRQPDFNEVFWLSVQAIYDTVQPDPYYPWGWTNHKHVFNDDAVQGYYDPTSGWAWEELYDQTGVSEDMSFVLFTDPEQCVSCPDYNIDFTVNFLDYADFADDWKWAGLPGGYNNSDLDCDGDADFYDLALFVQVWLAPCP